MSLAVNIPFNQHVVQHPYLALLTNLIPGDSIYRNCSAAPKCVAVTVLAKCMGHL